MNAAASILAVYGSTADNHLAALVGDTAYLAVPVADGLRIASAWRLNRPIPEWKQADFYGAAGTVPAAMRLIAEEGRGVVVLLRDTQMKMVEPGEHSPQTLRHYGLGAEILSALGLREIVLVSNSAQPKMVGLEAYGLTITGTRKITE